MISAANFDAVSFDVYGTILDWEPEVATFLTAWAKAGGLTLNRTELLTAYDRIRQPLQDQRPAMRYPEVLARTLSGMGEEFGIEVSADACEEFSRTAAAHKPFADSVPALEAMRAMGLKLAALSNIDDASFAKVTAAADMRFDVVVTAQRVGAYKPDHAHFWAALADLRAHGIAMARVLHVAQSRRADIVVANAIGLTSVWVNRPGHVFGRTGRGADDAQPDYEVDSLAAVVALLDSG